jgi:hypothetical protein
LTSSDSSTGPLDTTERRRHSRSYVAGVAVVSNPHHDDTGACLVRNLSPGGALLLSSPPLAPGETCRMVLTAPGLMGEQIEIRVNRAGSTSDGAAWAAVEFVGVSEAQSLRLKRVISLELSMADAPAALVVDGRSSVLEAVAAQLAAHSRRSHLANSALTAVDWLNARKPHIAVALVGEQILGTTPAALLDYIGEAFPEVHRIELDRLPLESSLSQLLDRAEAESAQHAPWCLSEFE